MAENIKKKIVVDASIILAFLLPDERKILVDGIFNQFKNNSLDILAPKIIYYEVLNGLRSAVLRRRINKKLGNILAGKFLELPLEILEIDFLKTFKLSIIKNFSFYDAGYVYLARQEKIKLLSLDKRLIKYSENP